MSLNETCSFLFSETFVFYIDKLFFLEPRINKLEEILMDKIDKDQQEQMKLISSIKGVSQRLAGLFLAEIKDIRNFPNAKKLIKYASTDPVVKQSGKYKLRMSISKQGSSFLRNILFQMATGMVRDFGSYKKAMIAVVNKLIRVIHALCRKRTFFDHSFSKSILPLEVSHV